MKAIWLTVLCVYILSLVPAGFMAFAAFAQRDVDLSGDAWKATLALSVYLIGVPAFLLLTRPRRPLADKEAAE